MLSAQHLEPLHSYDQLQSSHNSYPRPHSTTPALLVALSGTHPPTPSQTLTSGYSHPQQVVPETTSPTCREYPPSYHTSVGTRTAFASLQRIRAISQLQPPTQALLASHSPSSHSCSPTSSRGSNHLHNHQRMGSGIGNYGAPERELRERDQDWERERGQRPHERNREREGNDVVQHGGTPPLCELSLALRDRRPRWVHVLCSRASRVSPQQRATPGHLVLVVSAITLYLSSLAQSP
jgi:hypothetical protein